MTQTKSILHLNDRPQRGGSFFSYLEATLPSRHHPVSLFCDLWKIHRFANRFHQRDRLYGLYRPGLVMMAVINNSFGNVVSSFLALNSSAARGIDGFLDT